MKVKNHVLLMLDVLGYCDHIRLMNVEEENQYLKKFITLWKICRLS